MLYVWNSTPSLLYFEVDALQQLLHWCGFGWSALPPPPHGPLGLLLFFAQHIHIDELEGAHFVVEQAHPRPHGRLTDDVNHIAALENQKERLNFGIYIWLKNIQASLETKER